MNKDIDIKKTDTIIESTAVSAGNNIVKGDLPAGKNPGHRLFFFRNGKHDGYPTIMFDDTWKEEMKNHIKKDIKKLEDLKRRVLVTNDEMLLKDEKSKLPTDSLLKAYDIAIANIKEAVLCELVPDLVDKKKVIYKTVIIGNVCDLIGVK